MKGKGKGKVRINLKGIGKRKGEEKNEEVGE